ncbi:beta-1,3-glucanase family protein [Streptomyces sp. NPDC059837]|uniref:beta-1,3-glucanase family protein n=1 Tax=unclassified Streptomyces TaxID=2593676 RepID=UPI0036505D92
MAAPISMRTDGTSGSQSVSPLPAGALSSIATGLVAQYQTDGAPWNSLAVTNSNGTVLRVMSPIHSPTDFGSHWKLLSRPDLEPLLQHHAHRGPPVPRRSTAAGVRRRRARSAG